jgi:hypothetical protein
LFDELVDPALGRWLFGRPDVYVVHMNLVACATKPRSPG